MTSVRKWTCVNDDLHHNRHPPDKLGSRAYDHCVAGLYQVQVQVCFTSVCGQVQPLDVALSNSV
jgi:hypothetical protein